MRSEQALDLFRELGVLIDDTHVVLTSGRHGNAYVNKDRLYAFPGSTSAVCDAIAVEFRFTQIHTVIAPAVGGVILSQWTASHLGRITERQIAAVYADRKGTGADKRFEIGRGYGEFVTNREVLVVEDVLTTGGSVRMVVDAVRELGGNVVGVGVICNRGGVAVSDIGNVPKLFALTELTLDTWAEEDCPLCRDGVEVNTAVGKGAEFLARKQRE